MEALPEGARKLIEDTNLAHLVTLMKDGSPQVTPLWIDHDGDYVLVNTAEGRQKPLNLRRDNRVAVSLVDSNNGQHTLQVRGKVVAWVTGEEAYQHICKLSEKYTGNANYPRREGEERIILRIEPDHVTYRAPRA